MKKIIIILIILFMLSDSLLSNITILQATEAINYWKYYKNFTINIYQDIIDKDMKTTNYAYTNTQLFYPFRSTIYIDSMKFLYAPMTLFNVMLHEVGHFLGKYHSTDLKSIMNYSIKIDQKTGFVIEDNRRYLSKTDICTLS